VDPALAPSSQSPLALDRYIRLASNLALLKITSGPTQRQQPATKASVKPMVRGIEGLWIRS
jgi:hypothetical protein